MSAKNLAYVLKKSPHKFFPRDLHAEYIATIALIGTSMEEMATEIRSHNGRKSMNVEEHLPRDKRIFCYAT